MGDSVRTIRAVARLHGKTTTFVDGVVVSVSTPRLLCFLAMQTFRLVVASLLCYGGAYFIGHTIAFSDLILNCIALEVIPSSQLVHGSARLRVCCASMCVCARARVCVSHAVRGNRVRTLQDAHTLVGARRTAVRQEGNSAPHGVVRARKRLKGRE
jgi:hypothetical protein